MKRYIISTSSSWYDVIKKYPQLSSLVKMERCEKWPIYILEAENIDHAIEILESKTDVKEFVVSLYANEYDGEIEIYDDYRE